MKTTKLLFLGLIFAAFASSSAFAGSHWGHHHYYRPHTSVYFGLGLGYPFYGYGWGYPYYGAYPYGYGYYTPRTTVYPADRGYTDDATVAAVQRRLARGGYYHGAIDGVIGPGTRSAIRGYESNNGLRVDGVIDRELLRTLGLS